MGLFEPWKLQNLGTQDLGCWAPELVRSNTMEFRQSKQTSGNMAWSWVQKYFCSLCSICALNHQTSIKNPCLHLENLDPRSKSLQRVICLVARNSVSYFPAGVHVTHVAIVNDFPTQDGGSHYHQGVPGQKRFVFLDVWNCVFQAHFHFADFKGVISPAERDGPFLLRIPIVGSVAMMNAYGRWYGFDHAT